LILPYLPDIICILLTKNTAMTCGIYKLNFPNTNGVYIGQSINIEKRFKEHIRDLRNNCHSIKMNAAFRSFGYPTLEIVLECSSIELDLAENTAIDIWKSADIGFNTSREASGGCELKGENSPLSVYSNMQIIEVFDYLVDYPEVSLRDVSDITKVSYGTVAMISQGAIHKWLSEIYPDRYNILLNLKGNRYTLSNSAARKNILYPKIISPDGTSYIVNNCTTFAKLHKLNLSGLNRVLNYSRKSHKGWKLA